MAAFTVKSFDDLVRDIIAFFTSRSSQVTDFTPGSVARSMAEGSSAVMNELYVKTFLGFRRLLATVAQDAFNFDRKGGVAAKAFVSFTRVEGTGDLIAIPRGTQVSTVDGLTFTTDTISNIPAGQASSSPVSVTAESVGSSYNVSIGTIIQILDSLDDVQSVTNAASATGGLDAETEFDYQARFRIYVEGLAGSNLAGIETAALLVPGVTNATARHIIPAVDNVNAVVYVDDRTPSGVSDTVLEEVRGRILGDGTFDNPGYRAAGVNVSVRKPTINTTDFTLAVVYEDNVNQNVVRGMIENSLSQFVNSHRVGQDLLVSRLYTVIVTIPGVQDVRLTSPSVTIVVDDTSVVRMGTVTYA